MADFTIGQGARRPTIPAQLTESGQPINLTGASSVTLRALLPDGTTAITGTCTIDAASTGEVSYAWAANDTDTPGLYRLQFVITWSAGVTQALPTHRNATLLVVPSLTADS